MTDTENLLAASVQNDPLVNHIQAAAVECAPYRWTDPLAHTQTSTTAPPVDVPAIYAATVRCDDVAAWRVRPAAFGSVLDSLVECGDVKRWPIERAARQVTGVTASGIEIALTPADIRALSIASGKLVLKLVSVLGDMKATGKPERVGTGDGINGPLVIRLGTPIEGVGDELRFQARTLGEVERFGAAFGLHDQLEALFDLSEYGTEILDDMAPADGWFIMQTLDAARRGAAKALAGVRSFEFAMKTQFDPATPLGVLGAKQTEYAALFDKQAKAQKAAASKPRPTRRRR